jgi:hypothetical protein
MRLRVVAWSRCARKWNDTEVDWPEKNPVDPTEARNAECGGTRLC